MKRYRVLNFDIDFRASHLAIEINEDWEPAVKESHLKNKEQGIQRLLTEFGSFNGQVKIDNFIELGNAPFSILAYHNKFFRQIRYAFVIGSYYPALTAACALGERVLNHLMLNLRSEYKNTPEYGKIHRKASFDNWSVAINALEAWDVLLPDVVTNFNKLNSVRNKAIHFNPETDHNDRDLALEAINLLSNIIKEQFSAFGLQHWFIPNIQGASFIKKEAEATPFIKLVYLPNCALVGPLHSLTLEPTSSGIKTIIHDNNQYEGKEISDDDFAKLFNQKSVL